MVILGSPPLTRGKGFQLVGGWMQRRITPAYAGKRQSIPAMPEVLQDHPRLRGEKPDFDVFACWFGGSPPLTRGKVQERSDALTDERITPAYAGKSAFSAFRSAFSKDHPRLRGEKDQLPALLHPPLGSPPLTRGKGRTRQSHPLHAGITPAYAGKRILSIAETMEL